MQRSGDVSLRARVRKRGRNLKPAKDANRFTIGGCIDSLEVRKKPGGHWIIRDLAGLDLVGLASQ